MKTVVSKIYKVPQDLICDIFRILVADGIKYAVVGVHSNDNIISVQVDFNVKTDSEAKENVEQCIDDYLSYMQDIVGDAIVSMYDETEDDE